MKKGRYMILAKIFSEACRKQLVWSNHLGIDVEVDTFVKKAQEIKPQIIGMSTVLTLAIRFHERHGKCPESSQYRCLNHHWRKPGDQRKQCVCQYRYLHHQCGWGCQNLREVDIGNSYLSLAKKLTAPSRQWRKSLKNEMRLLLPNEPSNRRSLASIFLISVPVMALKYKIETLKS